jgi:hypothetical protein
MYLYTPSKIVVKELSRYPMYSQKHQEFFQASTKEKIYSTRSYVFIEHILGVKFYSLVKRKTVPVNGELFCSSLFKETKL